MNKKDAKRVLEKIEIIKKCKGNYSLLHKQLKKERLTWWEKNKNKLDLKVL